MLGKHFVLKDFPFYEAARLANVERRQARLDAWEKKCQERTLHQALGSTSQVTSSPISRLAKKKTIVRPQAQGTMTKPDEMFGAERIEWCDTIEPIVPSIIKELEEEEEEMVSNP